MKRQRKILTMEKKRNEINNKRENDQSRKGVDKWQEEIAILKSDIS